MIKATPNFEEYLVKFVNEYSKGFDSLVKDALLYSLTAKAKRLRPRMLWSIANNFGADFQEELLCATAIEMIHTYSLIHDDLPALDNDDLRRSIPTCHIAFDEATAILAGDALLTMAFSAISLLKENHSIKVLKVISEKAGIKGMIYGQNLDIINKMSTYLDYREVAKYKTGALFAASLMCGAIISDRGEIIEDLATLGYQFGILFQLKDDLLEYEKDEETSGKSLSDKRNLKNTAIALLGYDLAKNKLIEEYELLNKYLEKLPRSFPALQELIKEIYIY